MTWIVEHADGSLSQHHDAPGTTGIDPGVRSVEVPREIDFAVETWDWDAGAIVADLAGVTERINVEHLDTHGAHAIVLAHAVKAIEARLIVGGAAIDGMIAAEAAATGVPVEQLARTIADKAQAQINAEVARITARAKARRSDVNG